MLFSCTKEQRGMIEQRIEGMERIRTGDHGETRSSALTTTPRRNLKLQIHNTVTARYFSTFLNCPLCWIYCTYGHETLGNYWQTRRVYVLLISAKTLKLPRSFLRKTDLVDDRSISTYY